jgi:DNA primase
VFGTDLQKPEWDIVFVVEGVFDAIAINGLAILHGDVSEKQVDLIKGLDKRVIVVPDRDKAGGKLITRAIELGWAVSFPDWDSDIKDANDAVHRYGKLATIISIVDSVETSKIKIELRRKKSC